MRISKKLSVTVVLISISYLFRACHSDSLYQSYQLLDNPNGSTYYRLNLAVSQSLYEYYQGKSHILSSSADFPKFVTPHALEPIADSLWAIYADDEDFANGVLMITHQIPYVETLPPRYPVETLVQNEGDCDLLSYIAVSIIIAGGLDAVLLYYEGESHMNVGVHLSDSPDDVRGRAHYVTYNDLRYYVAECTGGDWRTGWRVGECPDDLMNASPEIVTLQDCEQWAPGQVSAGYETLEPSEISLEISSRFLIQGSATMLSGQLTPHLPGQEITIYIKMNSLSWRVLDTVITDPDGQFSYSWRAEAMGICYVRASWSGNGEYAGTDSLVHNIFVLPIFVVFLLAITVVLVCIGTFIFLISRRSQQEVYEPQPPVPPV